MTPSSEKTCPPQSSPRQGAFRILSRFEKRQIKQSSGGNKKHGKSETQAPLKTEALIHDVLESPLGHSWERNDKALLTALTYGVLRQWFVLEALISQLSRFPFKKIQPKAKTLLRLGLFQLRFMDHIPAYAAINSTVELAKHQKLSPKTVSFINGILREYQRRDAKGTLQYPDWDEDPEGYLLACSGLPLWFSRRLLADFPVDDVKTMASIIKTPPPLSLRVNTLKNTIDAYKSLLTEAHVQFQCPDEAIPEILLLEGFYGSPLSLPGYQEGLFYVQDLRSAQVCHVLAPQPNELIIDLCAAPGSKTTHIAAVMENTGTLWAVEPVKERLNRLEQNLKRLGVTSVKPVLSTADGFKLPRTSTSFAHRVLVDAPCSGLGTVRKHPEILLQLEESDLDTFPERQLQLLESGLRLLRPDGIMVYSTCSLDPRENQHVVQAFLEKHPNIHLESQTQHLITEEGDGFFWAILKNGS